MTQRTLIQSISCQAAYATISRRVALDLGGRPLRRHGRPARRFASPRLAGGAPSLRPRPMGSRPAYLQVRGGRASLFNQIDFNSPGSPKPRIINPQTWTWPRATGNHQFAIPGLAFQFCRFETGLAVWSVSFSLAIPATLWLIAAIFLIRRFRRDRPTTPFLRGVSRTWPPPGDECPDRPMRLRPPGLAKLDGRRRSATELHPSALRHGTVGTPALSLPDSIQSGTSIRPGTSFSVTTAVRGAPERPRIRSAEPSLDA